MRYLPSPIRSAGYTTLPAIPHCHTAVPQACCISSQIGRQNDHQTGVCRPCAGELSSADPWAKQRLPDAARLPADLSRGLLTADSLSPVHTYEPTRASLCHVVLHHQCRTDI